MSANITEQNTASTESIVINGDFEELKDCPADKIVKSSQGDLPFRRPNSIPNIAALTAYEGDAFENGLPSDIQEPVFMNSPRSAEDLVLPTEFQTEPFNSPTENDVQQSSCDLLVPSKRHSVSIPNLTAQMDSPQVSIIYKNDETNPITIEVKPKRRSLWKRTKRFVRHLFCFGEREVRRSSSGNLAVKTEFAVEKFGLGLPSAIQEPILMESPLFPEDLMLPMVPTVFQIESYTDPAEIDVHQSGCDLEDPLKWLSGSILNLVEQTESAVEESDTGLPSTIQKPILIDSPLFADNLMLPLVPTVLKIESYSVPAEKDVHQSSCELEDQLKWLSNSTQNLFVQADSEIEDIDIGLPSAIQEPVEPYSDPAEIDVHQSSCELEDQLKWLSNSTQNLFVQADSEIEDIDIGLPSAIQEPVVPYTDPAEIDMHQSTCAVLEYPNKRLSDSMQNITAQVDSEIDSIHTSLPNESINQRCEETDPVTTKTKSKRRSLWKRTKCIGRRLFRRT